MRVITIRDIAQKAGVSISTVSRVLNDRPDVDIETRKRVLEIVRKYQYTQNTNARNLKQKSVPFIAVIVRGRMNIFLTGIAERILELGRSAPYQYILEFIDETADEFEAARRLYAERHLAGIIFLGSDIVGHESDIRGLNLPCVFATIEGQSLPNVSSVSVDNRAAAHSLADMLFDLGHRRIAFVGYKGGATDSTGLRHAGVMDAYAAHGLPFDEGLFAPSDFSTENARLATEALLDAGRPFTAVVAISDMVALGVIKALGDWGLKVPDDVSVVGFDGIEISQYFMPPLTTMRQPSEQIAEISVRLIDQALADAAYEHVTVIAELLPGGSVRRLGPPIPLVVTDREIGAKI
ncbi:MAG: LacI family transcriptional regulator [Oscillospiraceae bacterium]|nr:LacI family transcriptional regulator [Oscillospiraceae bacterium]